MSRLQPLRTSLSQVLAAAKMVILDAAESDDFQTMGTAAEIAKDAGRWLAELSSNGAKPKTSGTHSPSVSAEVTKRGREDAREKQRKTRAPFPTFVRESDELIKIGKSRTSKENYEHRVPKTAVDAVVAAVASLSISGKRFDVDAVTDIVSVKDSLPAYQVYAVISWLKWAGLVVQHGRKGYSISIPQRFPQLSKSAWEQIAKR